METEFVPYEQAEALKELGFDEHCFAKYYQQDGNTPFIQIGEIEIGEAENGGDDITFECDAPLYQQVFKWFRKTHKLHTWVTSKTIDEVDTIFIPHGRTIPDTMQKGLVVDIIPYVTCKKEEQAELESLRKLIEIVKKKLGSVK